MIKTTIYESPANSLAMCKSTSSNAMYLVHCGACWTTESNHINPLTTASIPARDATSCHVSAGYSCWGYNITLQLFI